MVLERKHEEHDMRLVKTYILCELNVHAHSVYSVVEPENKHINTNSKCPATPFGFEYKEETA